MRALDDCPELTAADRNMLRALLEGADSLDIARDYRMSVSEIERRLESAFAKLGVTSEEELRRGFRR